MYQGLFQRRFGGLPATGLILEVRRSGGATYYLRYRDADRKARQYKIGARDALTRQLVRRLANGLHYQIASGVDPLREKRNRVEYPTLRQFFNNEYVPLIRCRNKTGVPRRSGSG